MFTLQETFFIFCCSLCLTTFLFGSCLLISSDQPLAELKAAARALFSVSAGSGIVSGLLRFFDKSLKSTRRGPYIYAIIGMSLLILLAVLWLLKTGLPSIENIRL